MLIRKTAGSVIQGLIALNVKDYVWHSYHGTLLTIAVIVFSIIFNTALAPRLPLLEIFFLILHIVGLFAIIVPLWIMAPRGNVQDVLFTLTDHGNWGSAGASPL